MPVPTMIPDEGRCGERGKRAPFAVEKGKHMHMKKLSLVVAFSTALLAGSTQLAHAAIASVHYVSPNPVGADTSCSSPGFNSIQAAVNASGSGDTVQVCP